MPGGECNAALSGNAGGDGVNIVKNKAASIRARLLNKAQLARQDFNWLLTRYGLERFLYRLSISPWKDQFLLKGALLFDLWFDQALRPTTDIDLLGFGSAELAHLLRVFKYVCVCPCEAGIINVTKTLVSR